MCTPWTLFTALRLLNYASEFLKTNVTPFCALVLELVFMWIFVSLHVKHDKLVELFFFSHMSWNGCWNAFWNVLKLCLNLPLCLYHLAQIVNLTFVYVENDALLYIFSEVKRCQIISLCHSFIPKQKKKKKGVMDGGLKPTFSCLEAFFKKILNWKGEGNITTSFALRAVKTTLPPQRIIWHKLVALNVIYIKNFNSQDIVKLPFD